MELMSDDDDDDADTETNLCVSLFSISIKTKANVDDMCTYAAKISVNWKARKSVTTDPRRPPFDV